MKIRLLFTFVGLAISFATPTFAQQKQSVDRKIIEQLDVSSKKYSEAINNNDARAVAALFTEDAVFMTNAGPLYGRQAIEKWYVDLFNTLHPKNYIDKRDPNSPRIIGTADNIGSNGDWSETVQGRNGELIQATGYWSVIHTREGEDWKLRMLIGYDEIATWDITPAQAAAGSAMAQDAITVIRPVEPSP
jgi:ketosteroid isomerase-like protein